MTTVIRPYFQHDYGEDESGHTVISACYMISERTETKVSIELNAMELVEMAAILNAALARRTCSHCGHVGEKAVKK